MAYNLESPTALLKAPDLSNLTGWYSKESLQVNPPELRNVVENVGFHLSAFVEWPQRALLLWAGCDRVAPAGKRQRYHQYPQAVRAAAQGLKGTLRLDARANGPAIAAFQIAGGRRPPRFGSTNAWSIHHLYSGKFPYPGRTEAMHACKEGLHFTQSAGLLAIHPVADALCDEFPFFAWLLRAMAFKKFGYDPEGIFSSKQDRLGFAGNSVCEIVARHGAATAASGR